MSHGAQVGVPVGFSAVLLAVMLSASGSAAMPTAQPATTNRTTSSPSAVDAATAALDAGGITPIVGQLPPVGASADGTDGTTIRVATDAPPMPAIGPDMASLAPVPPLPGAAIDGLDETGSGHIAAGVGSATSADPSDVTVAAQVASLSVVPAIEATSLDAEPPVPSAAWTTISSIAAATSDSAAAAAATTGAALAAAPPVSTTAGAGAAKGAELSTMTTSASATTANAATATTSTAAAGAAAAAIESSGAEPLRRAPSKRAGAAGSEIGAASPTIEATPTGTARSLAEPAAATHGAGPTSSAFSTGVYNVDRIRYVRAMAPNREVQRLALDLDGARISVRMDAGRATVGVLADPDDALGGGWVRQVERNIEQTVRAATSSGGGSGAGHSTSGHGTRQQGDAGSDAQQRRAQAQSTWSEHSGAAIAGMRWAEASHHLALQSSGDTTVEEA